MKKEILMLIIGILIGAIIATGCFLVLQSNSSSDDMSGERGQEMSGEMPSDMTDGEMPSMPGNSTEDNTTSTTNES